MAEIRVEPRKRSMTWLWLILLIAVIAAAVWYFTSNGHPLSATTATSLAAPALPTLVSVLPT